MTWTPPFTKGFPIILENININYCCVGWDGSLAPCTLLCTFTTFYVSLQCHLLCVLLVSKYWVIVNVVGLGKSIVLSMMQQPLCGFWCGRLDSDVRVCLCLCDVLPIWSGRVEAQVIPTCPHTHTHMWQSNIDMGVVCLALVLGMFLNHGTALLSVWELSSLSL